MVYGLWLMIGGLWFMVYSGLGLLMVKGLGLLKVRWRVDLREHRLGVLALHQQPLPRFGCGDQGLGSEV